MIVFTTESAVPFGQAQQDRGRLREPHPGLFEHGNFAHLIDRLPPFGSARDAACKIGPNHLEVLPAQRQHERKLVAVSGLREIVQTVGGHYNSPVTIEFNRHVPTNVSPPQLAAKFRLSPKQANQETLPSWCEPPGPESATLTRHLPAAP